MSTSCLPAACLPACRAACAARWIASRERRAAAGTGRRRRRAGRVRVGIRLVREPGGFIPAGACGSRAVVALLGGGEDGRTRIGARLIPLSAASPGTAILFLSCRGTNDCRLVVIDRLGMLQHARHPSLLHLSSFSLYVAKPLFISCYFCP